jgi:hypothetical protein
MIVALERAGFIRKQPRAARSIELLIDPKIPARGTVISDRQVTTTVTGY